jgi:UDPglucose 6-dehydrogenase
MSTRVTVIGTGYLGATHAACMAELGHAVVGVDVDSAKVAMLRNGRAGLHEPGLDAILQRHVASGQLRFTTSYKDAAAFGDVHFLCVGTPQQPGGHLADLRYLQAATDQLAPLLSRSCLVVGKSTVPVGTAARLAARIADLAPAGREAELAWNPEFLREGSAVCDTLHPDRLVIGAESENARAVLAKVYAPLLDEGVPVVHTSLATAELVKTAANAFLATKISFINAMAEICERTGGDVTQLSRALGYDARIGSEFLGAGLGFGGGCLPKDIRAFRGRAEELGIGALRFLDEVDVINMRCRDRLIALAADQCGGQVRDRRVAVLGAAFKPGTDDVRDSPALHVAAALHAHGATVTVFDPRASRNAARLFPRLRYAPSVPEAAAGADVLLHLTNWPEFRDLDPARLAGVVASRRVIDGRNTLDPQQWREAGWHYRALGRP